MVYPELASTVSAAQHTGQDASAITNRTRHHRSFHICIFSDQTLVALILLPTDVARVVTTKQHPPFAPSTPDTSPDNLSAILDLRAGDGATEGIGSSINRIREEPMDRIVARQVPFDDTALGPIGDGWNFDLFLAQPDYNLANAADLIELAEYQGEHIAHPTVWLHLKSIVRRAHVANRHVPI